MKTHAFLFFIFLCISNSVLFSQQSNTYSNIEKNYSIEFPSNWVYSYDKNAITSTLSACDSLDSHNTLMLTTGTTGALSLKEAYNVTKRNMKLGKQIPIESEGDIVLNNADAKWCIYTMQTSTGLRKIKMYILKKGARQYTIQAVMIPENFDSKIAVFDKVISGFRITEN